MYECTWNTNVLYCKYITSSKIKYSYSHKNTFSLKLQGVIMDIHIEYNILLVILKVLKLLL